jgi:hypothetical protein
MTADAAAAKTSDLAAAPSVLPAGVRTRILIYLGVLLVLLGFGSPGGGLIGLPISFLLKNKLHCHHGYLGSKLFSRISASATPRSRARRYQDRAVLRSPRALPAGSLDRLHFCLFLQDALASVWHDIESSEPSEHDQNSH